MVRLKNQNKKVCWFNSSIYALYGTMRAIGMPFNDEFMDGASGFLQSLQYWYHLPTSEEKDSWDSIELFLQEFWNNDLTMRDEYQEARIFFNSLSKCEFFDWLRPTCIKQAKYINQLSNILGFGFAK